MSALQHLSFQRPCCSSKFQNFWVAIFCHHLLSYGLLCSLILLYWKKKDGLTFQSWITTLTDTLHLERIQYILSDRLEDLNGFGNDYSFILKEQGGETLCEVNLVIRDLDQEYCSTIHEPTN